MPPPRYLSTIAQPACVGFHRLRGVGDRRSIRLDTGSSSMSAEEQEHSEGLEWLMGPEFDEDRPQYEDQQPRHQYETTDQQHEENRGNQFDNSPPPSWAVPVAPPNAMLLERQGGLSLNELCDQYAFVDETGTWRGLRRAIEGGETAGIERDPAGQVVRITLPGTYREWGPPDTLEDEELARIHNDLQELQARQEMDRAAWDREPHLEPQPVSSSCAQCETRLPMRLPFVPAYCSVGCAHGYPPSENQPAFRAICEAPNCMGQAAYWGPHCHEHQPHSAPAGSATVEQIFGAGSTLSRTMHQLMQGPNGGRVTEESMRLLVAAASRDLEQNLPAMYGVENIDVELDPNVPGRLNVNVRLTGLTPFDAPPMIVNFNEPPLAPAPPVGPSSIFDTMIANARSHQTICAREGCAHRLADGSDWIEPNGYRFCDVACAHGYAPDECRSMDVEGCADCDTDGYSPLQVFERGTVINANLCEERHRGLHVTVAHNGLRVQTPAHVASCGSYEDWLQALPSQPGHSWVCKGVRYDSLEGGRTLAVLPGESWPALPMATVERRTVAQWAADRTLAPGWQEYSTAIRAPAATERFDRMARRITEERELRATLPNGRFCTGCSAPVDEGTGLLVPYPHAPHLYCGAACYAGRLHQLRGEAQREHLRRVRGEL